jgi:hypothetical protein
VNSQFSGWTLNNKLYTYAYYHDGWNGEDVNGQQLDGTFPSGDVPNGTLYGPNNVPGQRLTNNYRSLGDIFRLEHETRPGPGSDRRDKYVGMRYGDAENTQPLGGYATADAAVNYTFVRSVGLLESAKLGVALQNLCDRTSIYYLSGYTGGGAPLYFTIPGRSIEATLTVTL